MFVLVGVGGEEHALCEVSDVSHPCIKTHACVCVCVCLCAVCVHAYVCVRAPCVRESESESECGHVIDTHMHTHKHMHTHQGTEKYKKKNLAGQLKPRPYVAQHPSPQARRSYFYFF